MHWKVHFLLELLSPLTRIRPLKETLIIPLSLSASLHVALLNSSAAAAAPPVAMKTAARETRIHIVLLTKYPWPWSRLFCECRAWMANFHEGYSGSSCSSWNQVQWRKSFLLGGAKQSFLRPGRWITAKPVHPDCIVPASPNLVFQWIERAMDS